DRSGVIVTSQLTSDGKESVVECQVCRMDCAPLAAADFAANSSDGFVGVNVPDPNNLIPACRDDIFIVACKHQCSDRSTVTAGIDHQLRSAAVPTLGINTQT